MGELQQSGQHPGSSAYGVSDYWTVDTGSPGFHQVEVEFLGLTSPGGSTIVRASTAQGAEPDGHLLVLWWDGARVHRWQGSDDAVWRSVWRGWNFAHLARRG